LTITTWSTSGTLWEVYRKEEKEWEGLWEKEKEDKQRERKNRENGRYGNWGQLSAGVVETHMQPKGTYCFSHYYN